MLQKEHFVADTHRLSAAGCDRCSTSVALLLSECQMSSSPVLSPILLLQHFDYGRRILKVAAYLMACLVGAYGVDPPTVCPALRQHRPGEVHQQKWQRRVRLSPAT